MGRPNGIAWDEKNRRFLVVPFGGDTIMAWQPGERSVTPVVAGPGQTDGVVVLPDGGVLVSSWATSSIHRLEHGKLTKALQHLSSPADFTFDSERGLVAVPLSGLNRVEFYRLPGS